MRGLTVMAKRWVSNHGIPWLDLSPVAPLPRHTGSRRALGNSVNPALLTTTLIRHLRVRQSQQTGQPRSSMIHGVWEVRAWMKPSMTRHGVPTHLAANTHSRTPTITATEWRDWNSPFHPPPPGGAVRPTPAPRRNAREAALINSRFSANLAPHTAWVPLTTGR